jgi:DMSO/TMAO reductase YedYZ heme-binding membrane subunit
VNLPWYVARAAGLVAWALLTLSLTWGFLLSSRVLGRRPKPRWLLDLHRFLGGLAVVFVGVHLVALLADTFVPFSPVQLLVPFTADYRPLAVSWGIVGFYLLLAVEITSLLMKRLPRRTWHLIHLLSYPLFAVATVHLLTAGTDSTNPVILWLAILAAAEVTLFTIIRLIWRRPEPAAPSAPAPATPVAADRRAAPAMTAPGVDWDRELPPSPPVGG